MRTSGFDQNSQSFRPDSAASAAFLARRGVAFKRRGGDRASVISPDALPFQARSGVPRWMRRSVLGRPAHPSLLGRQPLGTPKSDEPKAASPTAIGRSDDLAVGGAAAGDIARRDQRSTEVVRVTRVATPGGAEIGRLGRSAACDILLVQAVVVGITSGIDALMARSPCCHPIFAGAATEHSSYDVVRIRIECDRG
jgi:hypothetical protein